MRYLLSLTKGELGLLGAGLNLLLEEDVKWSPAETAMWNRASKKIDEARPIRILKEMKR